MRASYTISVGEVSALDHKLLDDTMEGRSFVAKALLAGSQRPDVLQHPNPTRERGPTDLKFSAV